MTPRLMTPEIIGLISKRGKEPTGLGEGQYKRSVLSESYLSCLLDIQTEMSN